MATYYAHINSTNNTIDQVIVADSDFISGLPNPTEWVQTYMDGTLYNYASIGGTYDPTAKAFIPPKPYSSWLLDTVKYQWSPPIPYPNSGGPYVWSESELNWVAR